MRTALRVDYETAYGKTKYGVEGAPDGEQFAWAVAACAFTEFTAAAVPFFGTTTVLQQTPTFPQASTDVTTMR